MNLLLPFLLSFLAGLSTGIGSLVVFFLDHYDEKHQSQFIGFAAGVMVYVSFMKLLLSSLVSIGFLYTNLAFFMGLGIMTLLDFAIPHEYEGEYIPSPEATQSTDLERTGWIVALGIAMHNFPEGLAAFFATIKDLTLGLTIMIAIALHNIPEGIAIAIPFYSGSQSKKKGFTVSLLSGLTEPVGAIVSFLFLRAFLSDFLLSAIMASIAGVMVFISFDELLPVCVGFGREHSAIGSLFLGMLLMAGVSVILD